MNTEQIIKIIAEGFENFDGAPDYSDGYCTDSLERRGAVALIEAGLTVAGCEDDEYALSEYVADGLPMPGPATDYLSNTRLAERVVNHINKNDGGFVALSLEASA
jgi:hypothetical protein